MKVEPIVLNMAGDILEVSYTDKQSLFSGIGFRCVKIGLHGTRNHLVYLYELESKNVIVCPEVVLRLEVPKSIDTYGKLREWCAEEIERQIQTRNAIHALAWQYGEKVRAIQEADKLRPLKKEKG